MNTKTLKNYYLTVGQKYKEEPHPLTLHPDGWARVIANDYRQAREHVVSLCGAKWAFLYEEEDFQPKHFPRGETALLIPPGLVK